MPLSRDVLRGIAEHHGVCVRPLAAAPHRPHDRADRHRRRPVRRPARLQVQAVRRTQPPAAPPADPRRLAPRRRTTAPDRNPRRRRPGAGVAAMHVRVRTRRSRTRRPLGPGRPTSTPASPKSTSTSPPSGSAAPCATPGEAKTERGPGRRSAAQDAADLPRLPVDARTVGRSTPGKHGRTYRPSMLLTLTLAGYGPVHTAPHPTRLPRYRATAAPCTGNAGPLLGTPIDPTTYDYRRAALDAIHFARVLDRFWQNLRRAVGCERPVRRGGRDCRNGSPRTRTTRSAAPSPQAAQAGRRRHLPPGVVASLRPARPTASTGHRCGTSTSGLRRPENPASR